MSHCDGGNYRRSDGSCGVDGALRGDAKKGGALYDEQGTDALAAAEVISHVGARPDVNLKTLAGNNGLL